jgi:hypothetical protein
MVENRRIFISHPRSTIPHRTTSNISQASPGTRQLPWYDEQPVTVHHRRLWDQPNTKRDRHSGSGNTPKIVGIWIHSLRLRCGDRRIRIIVEFARASSQCDARLHRNHRGTRPSERKTVRRVQKLSRHILRPIKHHILYTRKRHRVNHKRLATLPQNNVHHPPMHKPRYNMLATRWRPLRFSHPRE